METPAVVFEHVSLSFDQHVVLNDIGFSVARGSMLMLLGASGAGKSVILKLILGLLCPDDGRIFVNGERIDTMRETELLRVRADIGMLFQETALFDSLTVGENVGYRLDEEMHMPPDDAARRVEEVLGFVGLAEYVDRMPSELSGGQRRRVAIARAMASRPHLLLLDDPTTGLDPITSVSINDEIVKLRDVEDVTSIIVTHQIRDAFYVATHDAGQIDGHLGVVAAAPGKAERTSFMVLRDGHVAFRGTGAELLGSHDAYVKEFLYMTLPPW